MMVVFVVPVGLEGPFVLDVSVDLVVLERGILNIY